MYIFLAMAKIFDSEIIERFFKELIKEIIPSLNQCEKCNILKCTNCFIFSFSFKQCVKLQCRKCDRYRGTLEFLIENSSKGIFNYITSFLFYLNRFSGYSFNHFDDVAPIKQ